MAVRMRKTEASSEFASDVLTPGKQASSMLVVKDCSNCTLTSIRCEKLKLDPSNEDRAVRTNRSLLATVQYRG
jgi:hypothetical protein